MMSLIYILSFLVIILGGTTLFMIVTHGDELKKNQKLSEMNAALLGRQDSLEAQLESLQKRYQASQEFQDSQTKLVLNLIDQCEDVLYKEADNSDLDEILKSIQEKS